MCRCCPFVSMRSYGDVCQRISILGAAPQAHVCTHLANLDETEFELNLLRDQIGPENDIGGVNLKISSEVSGTVKIHDAKADQLKNDAEYARGKWSLACHLSTRYVVVALHVVVICLATKWEV
eukprot:GHVU01083209.1.p2 GENE.GHVU01083209.1~~GHVU01083209.1.p2  ORF type:complete len:123 (+),score=1.86 GHVU01083209.1:869-1237(+)